MRIQDAYLARCTCAQCGHNLTAALSAQVRLESLYSIYLCSPIPRSRGAVKLPMRVEGNEKIQQLGKEIDKHHYLAYICKQVIC